MQLVEHLTLRAPDPMATLQNLFRLNALVSTSFGLQFAFRPKGLLTELTIDDPKSACTRCRASSAHNTPDPAFLDGASTVAWMWGVGIQFCLAGSQYLISKLPEDRQIDFARLYSLWWAIDVFIIAYPARDRTAPHVLLNTGLMGALSAAYAYFGFVRPAIENKQK